MRRIIIREIDTVDLDMRSEKPSISVQNLSLFLPVGASAANGPGKRSLPSSPPHAPLSSVFRRRPVQSLLLPSYHSEISKTTTRTLRHRVVATRDGRTSVQCVNSPPCCLSAKSSVYRLATESGLLWHAGKILVVTVGLPARGKTHISRSLERYLRWMGVKTQVVSTGDYRRKTLGGTKNLPPDYFNLGACTTDRTSSACLCACRRRT